jgi:hypothetical protein
LPAFDALTRTCCLIAAAFAWLTLLACACRGVARRKEKAKIRYERELAKHQEQNIGAFLRSVAFCCPCSVVPCCDVRAA